jgi:vacuolar-type H+-ATPase subunit C/Vma6
MITANNQFNENESISKYLYDNKGNILPISFFLYLYYKYLIQLVNKRKFKKIKPINLLKKSNPLFFVKYC